MEHQFKVGDLVRVKGILERFGGDPGLPVEMLTYRGKEGRITSTEPWDPSWFKVEGLGHWTWPAEWLESPEDDFSDLDLTLDI